MVTAYHDMTSGTSWAKDTGEEPGVSSAGDKIFRSSYSAGGAGTEYINMLKEH